MNTAEMKNEFQKNIMLVSVLIAVIGTSLLSIVFKFEVGMFVLIYFVIAAIVYMGISLSKGD